MAFSYVGIATAGEGSAVTSVATSSRTYSAGNLVVVHVYCEDTTGPPQYCKTVVGGTNYFLQAGTGPSSSNTGWPHGSIWYSVLESGFTGAITATFDTTVDKALIQAAEYSFTGGIIVTDYDTTQWGSGSTTQTSPSQTPTSGSNALLVTAYVEKSNHTYTEGSNWNERYPAGTDDFAYFDRLITSASGSYSNGLTVDSQADNTWTCAMACFEEATGYPRIVDFNITVGTGLGASGTSLNMPANIAADDLLIIFASEDGSTSLGVSGWTQVFQTAYSTAVNHAAFAKIAVGSDTATLTGGSTSDFAAVVVRIEDHGVATIGTDIKSATPATSSGSNAPDPPSLDASSSKKWLWMVSSGSDDDDHGQGWFSSPLSGVAEAKSTTGSNTTLLQVGYRQYEAQTYDPPALGLYSTEEWVAQTIAIPPVSGVNYTHTGAVSGTDTWASDRYVEIVRTGGVSAVDSWVSTYEKTSLVDYTHTGAVAAVDSWTAERSVEKLVAEGVAATGTWAADRYVEKLVTGSIAATGTWASNSYYQSGTAGTNGFLSSSPETRHGTSSDGGLDDLEFGQRFTCPGSGSVNISEIGAWVNVPSAVASNFKLGIFTDNAAENQPETLVTNSESAVLSHNSATWVKKSHTYGTKPVLTGGTDYWLVIYFETSAPRLDLHGTNTGDSIWITDNYPTWTSASTWDFGSDLTKDFGIYAVYESGAGVDFTHQGTIAAVESWSSGRYVEIIHTGLIASVDSWVSTRLVEKLVSGEVAATETWDATRLVEKVIPGAVACTETWSSTYEKTGAAVDYTHQGAVAAVETWAANRYVEKMAVGSIAAVEAWATDRYVEIVRTGSVAATETWASPYEKTTALVDYTHTGAILSTGTWESSRTVVKLVPGDIAAVETWESPYEKTGLGLDYVHEGAVASTQTWAGKLRLPVMLSDSTYISAGTEATTNRLSTYHAGGDFVAGKISDDTNPLPSISLGSGKFTEIEYSLYVDGAYSDVFHFRVTPVGVYTVDPQFTVGAVDYVHQGAVASTRTWVSERTIDITRDGAVAAVETWASQRFTDRMVVGQVSATESWVSDRNVQVVRTGAVSAQEWWNSGYSSTLKDFLWQGAVLAVETWESPHPCEITKVGTLSQIDTWASEQYHERPLVEGAVASTQTWVSDRMKEKFVSGAISQIDTWSHVRNIERVATGSVFSTMEWQAFFEGVLLKFVHEGATTTEYTWDHTRYILKNIFGLVSAEETWLSEKIKEFTHQGAFSQIDTWSHIRNIERVKEGAVYSTETWSHIIGRQMVYIGTINGEDTWVSQKGFHKIIHGEISWEEFWASLVGAMRYFAPDEIYQVPARTSNAEVPVRSGAYAVPNRTPVDTVPSRTPTADYS